ncbi:hypothetical protein [Chitinophaga sp. sic0106]|uniref:hypothetical protein n=1 Tax=Chitinophaga sp. sic0106 TaxID=2854785 RepID=UPI001C4829F8|nr:hypothetical protein [Chitinophaga sp. sic0106]MBV7531177.1 hypothetical protein [Chitinophaga sp. sic0106]
MGLILSITAKAQTDPTTFINRGYFDSSQRDNLSSNGVYGIGYTGLHTSSMFIFNMPGTSTGSLQLEAFFWGDLKYRNKVDDKSWSTWNKIATANVDLWNLDANRNQRYYFAAGGTTYIQGYGNKPFQVMNSVGASILTIGANAEMSIGTQPVAGYKLAVAGAILAEKIKVKAAGNWPDYVFETGYELPTLQQLEAFIKINKHLPGVPSATDMKNADVDVLELNATLLKKVEELTLYLLQQQKEIGAIREENVSLRQELEKIKISLNKGR